MGLANGADDLTKGLSEIFKNVGINSSYLDQS